MTSKRLAQRIEDLSPRIIAYSRFIHSPELDPDDIQQEMTLAMLERGQNDPDFEEQKDAYLLRHATWEAKHAAEVTYTYNNHVIEENPAFEQIPDEMGDPARAAEKAEFFDELLEMISELSDENVTVIKMTYLGYSTGEIAQALHISAPAVSQHKKYIQRRIKSAFEENPISL